MCVSLNSGDVLHNITLKLVLLLFASGRHSEKNTGCHFHSKSDSTLAILTMKEPAMCEGKDLWILSLEERLTR